MEVSRSLLNLNMRKTIIYQDSYDERLELVKYLLDENRITTFGDFFKYIDRMTLARRAGIRYQRFLRLVKHPGRLNTLEIYRIASVMNIGADRIMDLILNQVTKDTKQKEQDHILDTVTNSPAAE